MPLHDEATSLGYLNIRTSISLFYVAVFLAICGSFVYRINNVKKSARKSCFEDTKRLPSIVLALFGTFYGALIIAYFPDRLSGPPEYPAIAWLIQLGISYAIGFIGIWRIIFTDYAVLKK